MSNILRGYGISDAGIAVPIGTPLAADSEKLGGIAAEEYALKSEIGGGNVQSVNEVEPDEAGNIELTAANVGARPESWTPTAAEVGARPESWMPTAADVGALASDGTAVNAEQLGGVAADQYALKSDIGGGGGAQIDSIYPVGSIYLSVESTSPANLFGGNWEQIKGRFLLGTGANAANTTTDFGSLAENAIDRENGEMGGESEVALTQSQLPKTKCDVYWKTDSTWGHINSIPAWTRYFYKAAATETHSALTANFATITTADFGGDEPHNNMPPYLAVYMWKRVS